MSQYAYSYGPYAPQSSGSSMPLGAKLLLAGAGGLLAHRGLVGAKRFLIMNKLKAGALKGLTRDQKVAMLKDMKLKKPYERWAQGKLK